MEKKNITTERDREATEKRLLETIGGMICESGFEKIGINAVAARSGVSKILIYRYFGSVEGLMAAYIRQHDSLLNSLPEEFPDRKALPAFLKKRFREQIAGLRKDIILKRLYRWELSSNNEYVAKIREQREKIGMELIGKISEISGLPQDEIASVATLLNTSITYLVMLEEVCPVYDGIPLNRDEGWEQIVQAIDRIIDGIFQ